MWLQQQKHSCDQSVPPVEVDNVAALIRAFVVDPPTSTPSSSQRQTELRSITTNSNRHNAASRILVGVYQMVELSQSKPIYPDRSSRSLNKVKMTGVTMRT